MKVTIVIPALNEGETIAEVIEGVKPFGDEVIVLDGGSRDRTVENARNAGARAVYDGGGGKGVAIRKAAFEAKYEIIVFIDADGSHEPRDIPKLVELIRIDSADIVIASRLRGGSSELHGGFDEFLRLTGSAFITACINKKFKVRISDSQNGFRAVRKDLLLRMKLRSNSTTIEQEMLAKALKLGARVAEIPSHEYSRKAGKSHIDPIFDAPKYLWSLIRDVLL
ncbi:TPA: glycosyltransferase family 2 protein [bacterium]|nr:MAG: hypothetical protein AUJ18_08795 [Candidatus Hydrogenedentes bacterium CG1_02_42_14]PIU47847.1 MAG: glycosyltransferase family 2 protein [Candidatus Hydrogenedentes bacterium CG07_land_8_20_14_0_80_42_17]HBW46982.1 glycosyltransferase family 2 protein [bacterium]